MEKLLAEIEDLDERIKTKVRTIEADSYRDDADKDESYDDCHGDDCHVKYNRHAAFRREGTV